MSNKPHLTPVAPAPDPIDALNQENNERRATLARRGVNLDVVELLLGVILEELGDEARLKFAERLKGVLDNIEDQHRRATLLRP